jgi:hypothetical protein
MFTPVRFLLAMSMALFAVVGEGAVVTKTNSTDGFFDNTSGTRSVSFAAGDFGGDFTTVLDVNVSISFAKSNNNSFVPETGSFTPGISFLNELEFVLTSPAGTQFTLISNAGDTELVAADNFESFGAISAGFKGTVLFNQSALFDVDVLPNLLVPGTYRPDDDTANSLNIFNGESALGNWTLFLEDDGNFDGLSFYEYSVIITTAAAPVPEPSSLLLCGMGGSLLAWGAARRRRQA